MSKLKDLTGMKFGRLTVIERAEIKNHTVYWKCLCDCGNETIVASSDLKRGKSQSCGCLRRESQIKDLTGQRFGRLTVIERAEIKNHTVYWKCLCDCGNETIVATSSLKSGDTKSCGCLKKIDLTGMKFGRLTVIERAENSPNGAARWLCRCDCGNETIVRASNLTRINGTKSCGCLRRGSHIKDLTGQRFGRLTVIERAEIKNHTVYWKCLCDCGNETIVEASRLKRGKTKSCGCLARERMIEDLTGQRFGRLVAIERAKSTNKNGCWLCQCDCGNKTIVCASNLKHGHTKSCGCLHASFKQCKEDLYSTWAGIKKRCTNFNDKNYAGRGITMYPEWIDSLQNFYDYVSKLKNFGEPGYTLDRIDVNGNYEPDNLRWADAKTQANNKRNTVFVDYYGEMITVTEVSERSGISTSTLLKRIKRGDTGERLFRPVENRGRPIKKILR